MCSISDLKCKGVGAPLQVRIIHRWKNDIRRYDTWYLAIDRFGDAIQILGQRSSQAYIESVFKLFDCYTISEYSCPELDRHQKVLENDFYIEVGLISVIKPLPNTMTIPKHWFWFVTKCHLMELGEKPPYYPVPTKFNRDLLIPLHAITIVAVTNLKPSTTAGMALPI
ncbi:unnamed protein product [Lactuca virosa]|uniref:Uncharacterized protein n=1 Tax=Lactuca virosa TaxID=75947 RepID=A0AAU9PVP2_9ASTR|nr:unnamed protein product [Lactuca virosa]